MKMILPKDFLSIEDLADYLNDLGWNYDLSVGRDHYRLHKDIYDLVVQEKIHLVFHHTGHVKETICDNDIDEVTGKLKNCTSKILYISAYFKVNPFLARQMLLDNKCTTTQGNFNLYSFKDGKKNPDVIHTFYLYDIIDDNEQNITTNDLYIPRDEIEELFNRNNQKSYEQKISDPESQLAQAKAELADTLNDEKELAPNSQVKVTHMLYAILKEHGYDLSPPKGKGVANDRIVAASRSHKSPVTRNFVANWLERVHQLDIELNK